MVLSRPSDNVPVRLNNGALLIGSFVNIMLYTLELVQAYRYYTNKSRTRDDHLIIKVIVALCLVVDTLGTAGGCAFIFLDVVNFWGDSQQTRHGAWPQVVVFVTTLINELVVQCFMVHRFFRISRNYIISCLILLLVAGGAWGMTRMTIRGAQYKDFIYRYNELRYVVIALASSALADVSITISLLWQLHRFTTYSRYMKELIRKISVLAVKTGTAPSVMAIACLIAFLLRPESQVFMSILLLIGRTYTSTMLFTLNHRAKLRKVSQGSNHINLSSFQVGRPTSTSEKALAEMHETTFSGSSDLMTPRSETLLPIAMTPASSLRLKTLRYSASCGDVSQFEAPSPTIVRYNSSIV